MLSEAQSAGVTSLFTMDEDEYMIGFGSFTEMTPEKQQEEELRALRYDVVNWLIQKRLSEIDADIVDDVLVDAELVVRYIYDGIPEDSEDE